ncbi:hypothetical protein G9A89_022686 [Geosiphon pyriformis]|nr:hypothetical protein G9A89_022686 [Geosiphon pyriformis]
MAELEIESKVKNKKYVGSVYSYGVLYKEPKKFEAAEKIVDLLAGFFFLSNLGSNKISYKKFWGGKVKSSISKISNVENMKKTITEKTSYLNLNASKTDKMIDDTMSKKTQTRVFIVDCLPKTSLFDNRSNNNKILVLLSSKFKELKQLLLVRSHISNRYNFNSVKFFALNSNLSAVLSKFSSNKLMAVKRIFYYIDSFGRAFTLSKFSGIIKSSFISESSLIKTKELAICKKIFVNNNLMKVNNYSDWEVIIKEILIDFSKLAMESVFFKFGKIVSIKIQLIGL